MKKILMFIVFISLIFTNINVISTSLEEKNEINIQTTEEKIFFSQAELKSEDGYTTIEIEEANSYLMHEGKPILPAYTKTFVFPIGTKIKKVECISIESSTRIIDKKIKPAPKASPMISLETKYSQEEAKETFFEDKSVYSTNIQYPSNSFYYKINVGSKDGNQVLFVTTTFFPISYNPLENKISKSDIAEIEVLYEEPTYNVKTSGESYDLVIIAPEEFKSSLQKLIKHKNDNNIRTFLKTTEDIYNEYSGRDKPEQIKYFIKDALDTKQIKYVMFVGGLNSLINATARDDKNQGSSDWHVPVRYSNLYDEDVLYRELYDPGYISDLYYADIYKYNYSSEQIEFEDWDSNGNNTFGEWTWRINESGYPVPDSKDVIDLYPEIFVGRLACRNIFEVKIMVDKIIRYENSRFNDYWFKKIILVGGDTFASEYDNYYEGEIETNLSGNYLKPLGFDIIRLWTSTGSLKNTRDITREISKGAGFVHITGHANPFSWATHNPNNDKYWVADFNIFQMYKMRNLYKLPIVVAGGCHNSILNTTLYTSMFNTDPDDKMWTYGFPTPECWNWWLTRKIGGGSIATIGCTGMGLGSPGSSSTSGLSGWIEPHFFDVYANQNKDILGETHSQTITDYLDTFSDVNDDNSDRKTVEQWLLLGDPSLKIGGYN